MLVLCISLADDKIICIIFHISELLLSNNMRQHKSKYIQRIEQLSLSNSYSESMQPPLHKHNSVQGNPCFLHLQRFEHFRLHPHLTSSMHAFEASASLVQIGFSTAPSIIHPKSWISYVAVFVCSTCNHILKAIWPFYYAEKVWKAHLV